MGAYWSIGDLNLNDDLNHETWDRSPQIQVSEVGLPAQYGAQQAMIGRNVVLPWTPDLFGRSSSTSGRLIVCGSAYAGFIHPFSGRNGHCLTVQQYCQSTVEAFQRIYVANVVQAEDRYYSKIDKLLDGITPLSQTLVMDLCRASFVKKGSSTTGAREDKSGDAVVTEPAARSVFERYVEAKTPSRWLWRRVSGEFGRRMLVLGSIAEHGMLRLFANRGMEIYLGNVGPIRFDQSNPRYKSGEWVRYYAGDLMKVAATQLKDMIGSRVTLQYWIDKGAWWKVRNPAQPETEWRILPAFHPTSQSSSKIQSTRKVLTQILL